jgi:hypothetical protein
MTAQRDDREVPGRMRLSALRVAGVPLNRCVLDVTGAMLVVTILAGLVALREQGLRQAQDANSAPRSLAGEQWFDEVPDRGALAQSPSAGSAPAPAPPRASPARVTIVPDAALGPALPGHQRDSDPGRGVLGTVRRYGAPVKPGLVQIRPAAMLSGVFPPSFTPRRERTRRTTARPPVRQSSCGPSPCKSSRDPVGGSELPRGPMAD